MDKSELKTFLKDTELLEKSNTSKTDLDLIFIRVNWQVRLDYP